MDGVGKGGRKGTAGVNGVFIDKCQGNGFMEGCSQDGFRNK